MDDNTDGDVEYDTDNDTGNNKGGYSNGDFSNSGPMPSEEEQEKEEGCRMGGFVVPRP